MDGERWASAACVICGKLFTVERKAGRPPITCSAACQRQRRNFKAAKWRETHPCPDHLHGLSGYTNYLCDCPICTRAEQLYMREYRDRKKTN